MERIRSIHYTHSYLLQNMIEKTELAKTCTSAIVGFDDQEFVPESLIWSINKRINKNYSYCLLIFKSFSEFTPTQVVFI